MTILERPVQRLYPLEVQVEDNLMASLPQDPPGSTSTGGANPDEPSKENMLAPQGNVREKCQAFIRAQGNLG